MARTREKIESEAIDIVDRLLEKQLISAKDAATLIKAICDKGNPSPFVPQMPNTQPYVPSNIPGLQPEQLPFPWKPGIIYCGSTGNGFDGVSTTL